MHTTPRESSKGHGSTYIIMKNKKQIKKPMPSHGTPFNIRKCKEFSITMNLSYRDSPSVSALIREKSKMLSGSEKAGEINSLDAKCSSQVIHRHSKTNKKIKARISKKPCCSLSNREKKRLHGLI